MEGEHPEEVAGLQETVPPQEGILHPVKGAKPEGPSLQKPGLPKRPNPARKYASHPSAFHAASQKPPPPEQSSSTTRECDTEPSERPDAATERYQKEVYRRRCLLSAYGPCTAHITEPQPFPYWLHHLQGHRMPYPVRSCAVRVLR